MTSDEDRREVARKLRELRLNPWDDAACEIASCLGIVCCNSECHGSDETPECTMALVSRLADLIEPSCDRDTPQKVAEEMFGKMRHSTKEEADAYDAMLKSKSVEIQPVDRDALLELADDALYEITHCNRRCEFVEIDGAAAWRE